MKHLSTGFFVVFVCLFVVKLFNKEIIKKLFFFLGEFFV